MSTSETTSVYKCRRWTGIGGASLEGLIPFRMQEDTNKLPNLTPRLRSNKNLVETTRVFFDDCISNSTFDNFCTLSNINTNGTIFTNVDVGPESGGQV